MDKRNGIQKSLSPWCGLCILILLASCSDQAIDHSPSRFAFAADFDVEDSIPVDLAEHFYLKLWAPERLLSSPVAISIDHQGHVYISETERRQSSDLDIRAHREWMTEDLALQSLEDTREFHLEKLDRRLSPQNQWQSDFNLDGRHDWADLMVQEERIRRLEDQDGDGRADLSFLYASGFNDMLGGVAAGILHHQQSVYLTAAPDLWKLEDRNQDGRADLVNSISHGYGIHIAFAGHDMSGLTIGPDGRIYWSIGDLGVNVLDAQGKRWYYPHEGAVMRINPDGTGFEVYAHGLRNPQELAFDALGNLISVDNDGDHPGERERIVHIVEGSDTGWRIYWQYGKYHLAGESYKVWMDEGLYQADLPNRSAAIIPPVALAENGPAGLAYNPGTALGTEWKNYFFSSHFTGSSPRSGIQAFQLKPKGASFELASDVQILRGIQTVGISFGPDGALYLTDWQEGYAKKTTGQLWKLDVRNPNPARRITQDILAGGMKALEVDDLYQYLSHEDMRVRMEAQFELVHRKQREWLLESVQNGSNLYARLHGIWGIGQLGRQNPAEMEVLLPYLDDPQAEVRSQTAKVMGDAAYAPARDILVRMLYNADARNRFFAAEALGKIGDFIAFEPIVEALAEAGDRDPYLRHAMSLALARMGSNHIQALSQLYQHRNRDVRLAAVLALRILKAPEVAQFLDDPDRYVRTEVARAIHDDASIPEAMPALAASAKYFRVQTEAYWRRVIDANLRLGDTESAQRLIDISIRPNIPMEARKDALLALSYWNTGLELDRVEGKYAPYEKHDPAIAIAALEPAMIAFDLKFVSLHEAVAIAIGRLGDRSQLPFLEKVLQRRVSSPEARIEALRALVQLQGSAALEMVEWALKQREEAIRLEAQTLMGEMELGSEAIVPMYQTILTYGDIPEKQKTLIGLANLKDSLSEEILLGQMERFLNGRFPAALKLDLLMAAEKHGGNRLKSPLNQYHQQLDSGDPLAAYRVCLDGGTIQNGKHIVEKNVSAQCLRCHQIEGQGGQVGPDLTGIASRLRPEQLLEALVDPNARVPEGYSPGAMPPVFQSLSRSEIRDLMAYLQTLK